jgi:Ras family protein A
VRNMTVKSGGSTYSASGATGREVGTSGQKIETIRIGPVGDRSEAGDKTVAFTAIKKLKARSVKLMAAGRSKKKTKTLRRPSEVVVSRPRQVHFRIPERPTPAPAPSEEESSLDFARSNPFRRSSKFRQPLRRVSRAKGSPPPVHFARIRPIPEHPGREGRLAQPNFDQTSDGESEGEKEEGEDKEEHEELPPILLLRNFPETGASDGGSTSSSDEEETYTILPATTVAASSSREGGEKEEEELADPPLARRASVANARTLIRRRSSYRASMRRGSRRRLSSCARRGSLARRRRSSVVAQTTRRKSTALPSYVVRRRSSTVRRPYDSSPSQKRRKQRHRPRRRRPRKIVVVGEMCSGKTSLISAYCRDKFSEVYVPTILTSCMTDADVLGEKIELVVVEVAGRNDFSQFRNCAYHRMDLAILCYSADSPASLKAIKNHWVPELLQAAPRVPYILVGTKKDVRDEQVCEIELSHRSRVNLAKNSSFTGSQQEAIITASQLEAREKFITTSQGLEAAEAIGAKEFIECSAMYRDGTRKVFETAAKLALRRSPRRKKKHYRRSADTCTIL